MPRKFFRCSVAELEEAFLRNRLDAGSLAELLEELRHRETERAGKLRLSIEAQLASIRPAAKPSPTCAVPPMPSAPTRVPPPVFVPPVTATTRPNGVALSGSLPAAPSPAVQPEPKAPDPEPYPPINDAPENVLAAWTALEVLSPQAFVKPGDLSSDGERGVAPLQATQLPWEVGEASRPKYKLYYQIVLGSIRLEPAIEKLVARYGDARPERPGLRGEAALAIVIVDQQGRPVAKPAVSVASFGWGVATALRGQLTELARWPLIEPRITERVESQLLRPTDGDADEHSARQKPLTRAALLAAYAALLAEMALPAEMVEPPRFAIRSYQYYTNPSPPDALLLNSFFLADLAWGRALCVAGKAPANLRRYLGQNLPRDRRDLLASPAALEAAVAPSATPLARWPGPGRHSLALLQQTAVNLAFQEAQGGRGLLGINGPPGTGKTTLLRDVVAGVVAARAEAMAKLDDPSSAFRHSGEKLKVGNSWLHLYHLDPSLRGFEMVVASSNNKAVENVSAALPGQAAVAVDATDLRYFKTLSDELHQQDTWGLIAAVLGNMANRARFRQTFWWDEDHGLNAYLAAATGYPRMVNAIDHRTGQQQLRPPKIVQQDNPPASPVEALERWNRARSHFKMTLEKSRASQRDLERLRTQVTKLPALAEEVSAYAREHADTVRREHELAEVAERAEAAYEQSRVKLEDARQQLSVHRSTKPGFWARLFRTQQARRWTQAEGPLKTTAERAQAAFHDRERAWQVAQTHLEQTRGVTQRTVSRWKAAVEALTSAQEHIAQVQKQAGLTLVDAAFFALPHERRQLSTPWYNAQAQRLRDDVFVAAVALHRAFIDAAAKPLKHNLGALMNVWSGNALTGAAKEALLPDLWRSLFLVVPLVSTTFAAVGRMLGKLPMDSLGWLLVDEAGQALPQAAVGALLRCQHALVVGDPVQIEPVVTLPETLTQAICRRFGVDPDRFAAPAASVQTLADAASTCASEFQTREGSRLVGVPLLVHRRCAEPMFGISNAVAYANLMVQAKGPKPSVIRDVLGPSAWLHVEGSGEDKWCDQEGTIVIDLLQRLAAARTPANLYIVTPFVVVAERLRQVVQASGVLSAWETRENQWKWLHERIGTVHTVQGREAEAVIFVLGAPLPGQARARGWAGGRPNLLNVAVTRAQEVLYVVGNRNFGGKLVCSASWTLVCRENHNSFGEIDVTCSSELKGD